MESMGVRQATSSIAELDALLHLSPAVVELRRWIAEVGLKAAMASFRVPPTTPLTVTSPLKRKEVA
jgi:enoyl-CoA hydratase